MIARRFWRPVPAVILLGLVVLFLAAGSALTVNAGTGGCKKVSGRVSIQPVTPTTDPRCTSPIMACAAGESKGDIKGSVFLVLTSLTPSLDYATTGVMFATGDAVFATQDGDLYTKDAITLAATGAAEFAEVDTITGGTGRYTGATGRLTATGVGTSGTYSGEICLP